MYKKKQWKFQNFLWHGDLRFHSAYVQYAIGKAIPFYSQLLLLVELNANSEAFISLETYQSEPREQKDTAKRCLALTAKLLTLELISPISILISALIWVRKIQLFSDTAQEFLKNQVCFTFYFSFCSASTQKAHNYCNVYVLSGVKAVVMLYYLMDLQRGYWKTFF